MDFVHKKIGIWGFGIVGKSALNYFKKSNIKTTVMNAHELTEEEHALLHEAHSQIILQTEHEKFLREHDMILVSPGIDLRPYKHYHHKFITELDIFAHHNKNKTVAITGTIGKTSITHLLSKIVESHSCVKTGGNIGTGLLDLLSDHNPHATIILELSSFQLEHIRFFAPDIAIWTNLYQNHLDRHETLENYFNAKYNLITHQNENQKALVNLDLMDQIRKKKIIKKM